MKIAIVSDAIYPYHKGGKETRIHELSTRLAAKGNQVDIYTMKWWAQPGKTRRENGVTLHAISPKLALYTNGRRSMWQGILFGVACFSLLKYDFDVVDVDHMPYFPLFSMRLVCLLKRKPMVATWHEVWGREYWKSYLGRLGFVASGLERLTVRMPNRIIAVSAFTEERLGSVLHARKPIARVENGINTAAIARLAPSPKASDLVCVGRLLSHKNIDLFVKAVARVAKNRPDIRALVIGGGPEQARLEQLAANLGVSRNIEFTGYVENDSDKFKLMKSSKVFVHLSTREGFGIVALEGMACGLPIITTNHPENAARYLVTPDIGLTCAPNAAAVARAIEKILGSQGLADPTVAAQSYDWNVSAKSASEVYAS